MKYVSIVHYVGAVVKWRFVMRRSLREIFRSEIFLIAGFFRRTFACLLAATIFAGPSGALVFGAPFSFTSTTQVKARVEIGGEWSALNEAVFVLP